MGRVGHKLLEKQRRMYGRQAVRERPKIDEAVKKFRESLANAGSDGVERVIAGWNVIVTIDAELASANDVSQRLGAPPVVCAHRHFHMSLRLMPPGRPDHDEDWVNLGCIAASFGVGAQLLTRAVKEQIVHCDHSRQSVHFVWTEPDAPSCPIHAAFDALTSVMAERKTTPSVMSREDLLTVLDRAIRAGQAQN